MTFHAGKGVVTQRHVRSSPSLLLTEQCRGRGAEAHTGNSGGCDVCGKGSSCRLGSIRTRRGSIRTGEGDSGRLLGGEEPTHLLEVGGEEEDKGSEDAQERPDERTEEDVDPPPLGRAGEARVPAGSARSKVRHGPPREVEGAAAEVEGDESGNHDGDAGRRRDEFGAANKKRTDNQSADDEGAKRLDESSMGPERSIHAGEGARAVRRDRQVGRGLRPTVETHPREETTDVVPSEHGDGHEEPRDEVKLGDEAIRLAEDGTRLAPAVGADRVSAALEGETDEPQQRHRHPVDVSAVEPPDQTRGHVERAASNEGRHKLEADEGRERVQAARDLQEEPEEDRPEEGREEDPQGKAAPLALAVHAVRVIRETARGLHVTRVLARHDLRLTPGNEVRGEGRRRGEKTVLCRQSCLVKTKPQNRGL